MKIEQLEEAQEILKLIEVTKKGLDNLKKIQPSDRINQRIHDDRLYNFNIGEYGDRSGNNGNLCRYSGNVRLLAVIIEELEKQLEEFNIRFETL